MNFQEFLNQKPAFQFIQRPLIKKEVVLLQVRPSPRFSPPEGVAEVFVINLKDMNTSLNTLYFDHKRQDYFIKKGGQKMVISKELLDEQARIDEVNV